MACDISIRLTTESVPQNMGCHNMYRFMSDQTELSILPAITPTLVRVNDVRPERFRARMLSTSRGMDSGGSHAVYSI